MRDQTTTTGPDRQPITRPLSKKVVIIDDSHTMRGWLRVVLERDPRLEVVGEAANAQTARSVIKQTNPDVITLDIEMPGLNGLEFLERLMRLRPLPTVMISGATKSNSEATIHALTLGAVDCILKPSVESDPNVCREIAGRVLAAARSTVQVAGPLLTQASHRPQPAPSHRLPLILIGASTGGVVALERVLSDLHESSPPIVIVQHMPGPFLVSFSQHLNRSLPQNIAIARAEEPLGAGDIRLAPGIGQHTIVVRNDTGWCCRFVPDAPKTLHCPSVDMLFQSGHPFGRDIIAVILTGLGQDGATAMLNLRKNGAHTIGQDAATSVIYGMPRVAAELGALVEQHPLEQIGAAVNRAVLAHTTGFTGRAH